MKAILRSGFGLGLCIFVGLGMMMFSGSKIYAEDPKPDEFAAPAEGGDKPAEKAEEKPAEGGSEKAEEKSEKPAEAGDTPANPEESPDKPAESPAGEGDKAATSENVPNVDEADQVESLVEKFPYSLVKTKDPFRPVVEKKVAVLPTAVAPKPMKNSGPMAAPPPPPPPPLKLSVQGIVGNDGERLAMIIFENEMKTVKKDEDVKGKFKVVDILPDKVVVYSNKEQMRRTFPIGGGK